MLRPNARFKRITDIKPEFFKENNIKGLILDLDNTLIDSQHRFINGLKDWICNIKNNDIRICIATNSIKKEKIIELARQLDIPYVYISLKPLKYGIKKAKDILKLDNNEIAEIGDQLFTDVWVSNRMNLFSILTEPVSKDKLIVSRIKRKIEKWYLSRL